MATTEEERPHSDPPDRAAGGKPASRRGSDAPTAQDKPAPSRPPLRGKARIRLLIARAFGITQSMREATITALLHEHQKSRLLYWLPLMLAVGIATLGLALGSTAVVIGAMLVSPLMGPIVEVGMGLAIGSPMMVLNSSWRTGASILAVVLGSALLTYFLPYQQMTAEIASRTSPTALDLVLAAFCGLAASYTTIRDRSDVVSTAAGTAIAIALVPPLCVTGWSLATAHYDAAFGSALLFVANLCAIIAVAVLLFYSTAFGRVDVAALEREAGSQSVTLDRVAGRLREFFGSRYGWLLRYVMPAFLIGAVSIPLWTALREVSWQVTVRTEIDAMLNELPGESRPVSTALTVERGTIVLRLVIVDPGTDVADLRESLRSRIIAVSGVENPTVEVIRLPNFDALRGLVATPAAADVAVRVPDLVEAQRRIEQTLTTSWPDEASARITTWSVRQVADTPTLTVVHLGPPIGEVARSMLEKALSGAMATTIRVEEIALSLDSIEARGPTDITWAAELDRAIQDLDELDELFLCIEVPAALQRETDPVDEASKDGPPANKKNEDDEEEAAPTPEELAEERQRSDAVASIRASIESLPPERVSIEETNGFRFRRSLTSCDSPTP